MTNDLSAAVREIKFRYWDNDAGAMVGKQGGMFVSWDFEKNHDPAMFWGNAYGKHIEQFTGLRDRNGVEIYEGDIVRFGRKVSIVGFDAGSFLVKFDDGLEQPLAFYVPRGGEVIGNVHEHPHLLEGAEVVG